MATEDFTVLLALSDSMLPPEVFDRKYLVEYHFREIWLDPRFKILYWWLFI
jgi:hypothetical protein